MLKNKLVIDKFYGQGYHCDLQKNETILISISLKRYFSHSEKSILNLSLP